jgi:hypothetical protein
MTWTTIIERGKFHNDLVLNDNNIREVFSKMFKICSVYNCSKSIDAIKRTITIHASEYFDEHEPSSMPEWSCKSWRT